MYNLLSVSADSKTIKGEALGYLTGILYLQPASLSGKNLCPGSSPGCRAACLYTAGMAGAFPAIYKARERKTRLFLEDRNLFLKQLMEDISKLCSVAKKRKMKPVVRLNGTTDIDYNSILIDGKTIFEHFPKVRFMDYTKVAKYIFRNKQHNYHFTFSRSEKNGAVAETVLAAGHNIAVVFKDRPKTFLGRKVVDGDKNDLRFLDKKGVVVGLKAKGKAKKDTTGFVI